MHLLIILSIYFVSFTNKLNSTLVTFSERAIEQREKWNIPYDSLDYTVSPTYLDSIRTLGARVLHTSRWMNGATVEIANMHTLETIKQCSFVDSVELTRDNGTPMLSPIRQAEERLEQPNSINYGNAQKQLEVFNLPALHAKGFEGQNILMAVVDAGFQNMRTLSHFASLREHVVGWRDLTDDADSIFGSTGNHGAKCLSLIGMASNDYYGAATQASFYLMKAEENYTESPKEMDNLVVAYELADSMGANIVSTSLGYYEFDNKIAFPFTYQMLDGKTLRVSRAATIAARKGILVCNAAGNYGNKTWVKIAAPADADSILTVGAVQADSLLASFSSRGPSADGRIKPEVCAMGYSAWTIEPSSDYLTFGNGTSFACPLLAGLAACVWSALPDENAMQIRERIIQSCNRYNTPNNDYGYGIPDAVAAYAVTPLDVPSEPTPSPSANKIMLHGRLYIRLGNMLYDMTGNPISQPK